MKFVSRVFELQTQLGGLAAIENPRTRTSDLWRHPDLQQFVGTSACFDELDMCQYGDVQSAGRATFEEATVPHDQLLRVC